MVSYSFKDRVPISSVIFNRGTVENISSKLIFKATPFDANRIHRSTRIEETPRRGGDDFPS